MTTAPVGQVASSVRFAGHVIVGGSVSLTVIVCVQDEWLPEESVAVQVIVVVPTG